MTYFLRGESFPFGFHKEKTPSRCEIDEVARRCEIDEVPQKESQNVYENVLLPGRVKFHVENYADPNEKIDIHEWWAENTIELLNEIQLLWVILTEANDDWAAIVLQSKKEKKRTSGYPTRVIYKWKSANDKKPTVLSIESYVDHVLYWLNSQVENEEIFPTDEEQQFPDKFMKHLKPMFKLMFRILAVIYSNPCLCENEKAKETSLEHCFKHFLYFGWKWKLLSKKETKSISHITDALRESFENDQRRYLESSV